MANETSQGQDGTSSRTTSIEQLLEAEKAIENLLAEAKKDASRKIADAYGEAQAIDKETSERIAGLARKCAEEKEQRVGEILARAKEVGDQPVDTQGMQDAIREAAATLAARLTGGDG
ncbi:MAG: hypothetical protein LJE67_11165 [Salaquimonas sp.]|jgi:vacuolar-type H+-ATPase subunit H|nr:hypothetical protein [Salaquimonas sp.]